jgi:Holliday junction resolvasome RuvABC endonuclease subunit
MIVETPAGSQSSRAAASMASAFAICAALSATFAIPAVLVSAEDAKLAATGKRNGSKAEVAAAVSHFVPASAIDAAVGRKKSASEHITDAAALVLAAWNHDIIRLLRQQDGE